MSNVAQDYPARREFDSTGAERVWFKAAIRDSAETWGWTCDPAQAHPDYQVKIGDDGSLVTWAADPWHADVDLPHCVVCNRTECDGGAACLAAYRAAHNVTTPQPTKGTAVPTKDTLARDDSDPISAVTDFDVADPDVEEPRFTQWSRYPLPLKPPRAKVVYDGYGRYKLPSPTTGRPTAFSRATTIADTLDETYNLNRWKRRQAVKAIFKAIAEVDENTAQSNADGFDAAGAAPTLGSLLIDAEKAIAAEDDRALDGAIDMLDNLTGGRDAAELGEAVHAWLEAVDIGTVLPADVPDMFKPYVAAYRDALRRAGLIALPQYVERIVLNDQGEETIAGTIDRIFLVVATGELVMGDVKTSKTLEYGWLTYSVQVGGVYGYATKMFRADGDTSQGQYGWEPMPEIGQDYAIILHVPSDQPERSAAVTIDMYFGGETMITSLEVRRRRKAAPKAVASVHEIPVPTKDALRYVAARDALLDVIDPDQLADVWEAYQDVWDEGLTELGEHVAELLSAHAPA